MQITRGDFEAACEDLFARLTAPIDQALAMAGLTLEQVGAALDRPLYSP